MYRLVFPADSNSPLFHDPTQNTTDMKIRKLLLSAIVLVLAAAAAQAQFLLDAPIPDVAWWKMETAAGGVIPDSSGNGHTAIVFGSPTFGNATPIGHGFVQFDGNSWLLVNDADSLDLTNNWTISLWTKPAPLGQLFNGVELWLRKQASTRDGEGGYSLILDSPGRAGLTIFKESGNFTLTADGVDMTTWNHIAATFNATNSQVDYYINGVLKTTAVPGPLKANTYPIIMGADLLSDGVSINPEYRSHGALADVRIYGKVLSAAEVLAVQADRNLIVDPCPCNGPSTGVAWKSHGQYVSCVAKAAEAAFHAGVISEEQRDTLVEQAAQSNCGKKF